MTYEEAVDQMFDLLKEAWAPTGYAAFYDDVAQERMGTDAPFIRAFIRHSSGGLQAFGSTEKQSFERMGYLMVQIYTPVAKGLSESYRLAKIVSDAFEGKSTPEGVWFRRGRISEAGKDGMFKVLNFVTDFEYTEIK